jgi:hypothetical protein
MNVVDIAAVLVVVLFALLPIASSGAGFFLFS